jgi:hypothetical protein
MDRKNPKKRGSFLQSLMLVAICVAVVAIVLSLAMGRFKLHYLVLLLVGLSTYYSERKRLQKQEAEENETEEPNS